MANNLSSAATTHSAHATAHHRAHHASVSGVHRDLAFLGGILDFASVVPLHVLADLVVDVFGLATGQDAAIRPQKESQDRAIQAPPAKPEGKDC